MSGLKGGAVLVLLAIPLALYAAWQVNGVARTDMIVSDPPADRGPPKDQLTAAGAKAAAWAAETRKAAADATRAMDAMTALLRQYSDRSKFADRVKAENWRVRARLAVIDALSAQAEARYREAVAVKLPLEAGNPKVKAAAESLRGVSTH